MNFIRKQFLKKLKRSTIFCLRKNNACLFFERYLPLFQGKNADRHLSIVVVMTCVNFFDESLSLSLSLSTRRKCLEWIIMNRYISRLFLLRRKLRSVIFSALSFHWEWMLRMNYNRKLTLEKLDPLSIFS